MKSYPFITEKYTAEVITIAQAKEWLEMDIKGYKERDELIESCLKGAIASVEEECNFQLGVSTYTWNTHCVPHKFTDTFYVTEIVSIKADGLLLDSSTYQLIKTSKRSSIISWHSQPADARNFEVIFKAGLETVEPAINQAIRARIGDYYENRGDSVSEKRTLSDKLLAPYIIPYAG